MLSRALCLLSAGILLAQTAATPEDTARKALDLLIAKKYADLVPMFTPNSRAINTEANLAKQIPDSWGPVQTIGTPQVQKLGTNNAIFIPVKFANQEATFAATLTEKGELGIINFRVDPWKHPPYSKPDSFKERAVTIGAGTKWALGGTLTVPDGAGPFPGVVLVHDAGAADRDEIVGSLKVFKDLAEGLASRGIVVLRYDKRTKTYPSVAQLREYTAEAETIDDAVLAAGVLRAQPEVKPGRIFELGFGFGGYVMPRIAEADGKLAGVVLLNANERPLEDLALDEAQYREIKGPQLVVIQEQAARIKKLTQADEEMPALLGMQGPYVLDLKGYDPAGQAKLLGTPMLILQGSVTSR